MGATGATERQRLEQKASDKKSTSSNRSHRTSKDMAATKEHQQRQEPQHGHNRSHNRSHSTTATGLPGVGGRLGIWRTDHVDKHKHTHTSARTRAGTRTRTRTHTHTRSHSIRCRSLRFLSFSSPPSRRHGNSGKEPLKVGACRSLPFCGSGNGSWLIFDSLCSISLAVSAVSHSAGLWLSLSTTLSTFIHSIGVLRRLAVRHSVHEST